MAQELERDCPKCEETRTFSLAARTKLHLGVKTKWTCPECGHTFVRIDGDVDTGQPA